MRKIELDHLLENAVAKGLGLKAPHVIKASRSLKKSAHAHRNQHQAHTHAHAA